MSLHEPLTNIRKVIVLVLERDVPKTEVWRALYGAAVLHRAAGKYVIALYIGNSNIASSFGAAGALIVL